MRILILAPGPTIHGGVPKVTAPLVSALRALGCDVTIHSWGRRREQESVGQKMVQRLADIRSIRAILRHERFDVLLVETAHDWATLSRDIPLFLATRALARRTVLQFHGSFSDRLVAPGHVPFKLASALLLALTDAAFVLSSEEQRQWQAFYPRGRFYTVCNAFLPLTPLNPEPDRSRLALPAELPIVLFVGRLMEAKGVLELLDMLPQVLARIPVHLLIAGEGPLEAELRQRATRLGVGHRLTIAGYLQDELLQAAYQCADIFALPTRWAEGFPLAIAEAMGAGLPIITTRIRGMADHLHDGVNALFVPSQDPAALADAVIRLLSDPQTRARIGQANRDKVRELAPDRVGRHHLQILREVLDGPTRNAERPRVT
jgi:glycosyltransferase involved in cell wall biosynthesis